MPMFRLLVGMLLITLSLTRISPPSMVLNPMIIRSSVVFPHPEGPSRVKNSPGLISADSPWITTFFPYILVTLST